MKILFVDDDAAIRLLHTFQLRKWGYQVVEAANGSEAWEKLSDTEINFIICDWMMPEMTGIELCKKIRDANLNRYIYVLLCTAKDRREDITEGHEAGADDFLIKPIIPEELRARLRSGERVLNLEKKLEDRNRQLQDINRQVQGMNEQMQKELVEAAGMQISLLPPASPRARGISAEWVLRPSYYVAGDIFNLYDLDDHNAGFYILDVAGHGVPAAMFSVTLTMLLQPAGTENLLRRFNEDTGLYEATPPDQVLAELNKRFMDRVDKHFTMIYGVYDSRSSILRLSQGGQPQPLLIRKSGEIERLAEGGYPLGIWPESEYEFQEVRVSPGDRLILYSDGISECRNKEGFQFGEARILRFFQRQNQDTPLRAILAELEDEIQLWNVDSDTFEDDISILALEFREEDLTQEAPVTISSDTLWENR